jgi:toxin ParE1/3/4
MTLDHYTLSKPADQDLENIFDYTEEEFSLDQAINYLNDLEILFDQLVVNPELGRDRSEIKSGLRSIPKTSHVIFYRIMPDNIRIIRVLHGSRDLIKFLDE